MSGTVLTYKTIFTNIAMRPQLDVVSVYYIIKELLKLTMTIIFLWNWFFLSKNQGYRCLMALCLYDAGAYVRIETFSLTRKVKKLTNFSCPILDVTWKFQIYWIQNDIFKNITLNQCFLILSQRHRQWSTVNPLTTSVAYIPVFMFY